MSGALQETRDWSAQQNSEGLALQCPACEAALPGITGIGDPRSLRCGRCSFLMVNARGIWKALPENRRQHYSRFIRDYEAVRFAERRGSSEPDFYLALPFRDLTHSNQKQWNIRARTYKFFVERILPDLSGHRSLRVLDLGAGNCWLSYRLALRGDRPVAVDLLTNEFDGLGAAVHYSDQILQLFPRFQAEHDRLPFQSGQFDCVIFNASFHYSDDYTRTLSEALRCIVPGGFVAILDSPWYSKASSGEAMLSERRSRFRQQFGFASDALPSLEYLTDERLENLARSCGVRWRVFTPFYGFRWAMRPWIAKIKRRREPSLFRVYIGEVSSR